MKNIKSFEEILGYRFNDKKFLKIALTHSSYSNEYGSGNDNYERFEFLGDAILGFITSEFIFKKFDMSSEGDLTRLRASLVCEKTLKNFAKKLHIGEHLRLSRGENRTGGRDRASILADVFESVVAAIFLDGGLEPVKTVVLKLIDQELGESYQPIRDYKTEIQEIAKLLCKNEIKYSVVSEEGPDHDKKFTIELEIDGISEGIGIAKSKKEAEQLAAKFTLEKLRTCLQ
ncbi:MAG: ribonuclease III [Firmicutes bacterium]|nr:ribonuclease III [Bacillota bacterium]